MVVITEDDLADLPLPTKRTVDVLEFVPLSEVDPKATTKAAAAKKAPAKRASRRSA